MPDRQEGAEEKETGSGKGQLRPPAISLPKGGGAIRDIGEKFAANPVTGTGSMTVPIATSPGRSGFGPQLSLSYDSGAGNGPFSFGWNLSVPSITRKTDKGLPRYRDEEESDTFILSDVEDLVPFLEEADDGTWPRHEDQRTVGGVDYVIHRYRPRIEGLFARIERWSNQSDPADVFWRSISRDNITTWYGKTDESRITDPYNTARVFSWLIHESYDDKGNVIVYGYKAEDSERVNQSQVHERNRTPDTRKVNRYLKRIRYGNHQPHFPKLEDNQPWPSPPGDNHWYFEVVFDYGEHDENIPLPQDLQNNPRKWECRHDPFSSYRAGFEVRTYRLCQRALMFHHFEGEDGVGKDCLIRSTDFTYRYEQEPNDLRNPIQTVMVSATQSGYQRKDAGGYLKKSLPPLELEYSKAIIQEKLEEIDAESLENLPQGLDGAQYQWADLDGEGAGGILTEQNGGWYYKRNLSPLPIIDEQGQLKTSVRFAPVETITPLPSFSSLSSGQQQILDLAGDGQVDVVTYADPAPGFFERTDDGGWKFFKSFKTLPNINWQDPNLKFVDLTGDGHADIFITEDSAFTWYPSLAEVGFAEGERVHQALDEEKAPRLVFADGTDSIYLSDLSGDGLSDLARIRNGEVCYWPNLGYGCFGAKVTMDNAPWFDYPDQFDQKRVRLADIDGTGVTDILYLKHDGVRIYFNQSGNSWSDERVLDRLPAIDNTSSVMAVDLMGNGTACLVWSSPLPGNTKAPMRYVDLMGGQKPHLLTRVVNNLGAETRVQYAPSTKFYLQDKEEGKPWITRLHFPVHVVERVETYDHISHNRFVTRYAYHHGYFDGHEREFRGFGMVEQRDTEEYAALSAAGEFPQGNNIDLASHVPPVHTKTWFHTGAYLKRHRISNYFETEYYREPAWLDDDDEARKHLLEDTVLPDKIHLADGTSIPYQLSAEEEREACRALKGKMLRQEVYAIDGTDKEKHPYTVTEQNFTIRCLQGKADKLHAVFFTHAQEAINYHYERNPADPRVSHSITLAVDNYGNVLKSLAIAYGRLEKIKVIEADGSVSEIQNPKLSELDTKDQNKHTQKLITYTENEVTNVINDSIKNPDGSIKYPHDYRTPLPSESRTYELTGLIPDNGAQRFSFKELTDNNYEKIRTLQSDPYETPVDYSVKRKRLIEHVRTLYRKDNMSGFLDLGELDPLALPGESYKLAFTPGLIGKVFQRPKDVIQPPGSPPPENLLPNPDSVLLGQGADRGGYVDLDSDDHWWIPSGQVFYHQDANADDPAATAAQELTEAHAHFYLPRKYTDPFKQRTTVEYHHDLLLSITKDVLDNIVEAVNDFRVLQPKKVINPNKNRSFATFDALGLVVATAVAGNEAENIGDTLDDFYNDTTLTLANPTLATLQAFVDDPQAEAAGLLKRATTRSVYDLDRFSRTFKANPQEPDKWQPPFAANLARETHVSDLQWAQKSKIQISFSYSDGFSREIQKKIQAEPGPVPKRDAQGQIVVDANNQPMMTANDVDPRWVGSGWTVFNNKGKPVRQFEPFFIDRHTFEFDVRIGVSPYLFYDPVGRVVCTLHPNHTYEKDVFDPWRQVTFDVNDTVAFTPSVDDHVKGFFLNPDGTPRIPSIEYLPTWHELRTEPLHAVEFAERYPDATDRSKETGAAVKAAAHADTPTTADFDTLGRTFLTVVHNKVVCPGHMLDGTEDQFATRVELDIEGNQREVKDERKKPDGTKEQRIVMRYSYYMAGPEENEDGSTPNRIHQASMEAGERWILNDIAGNPIRSWDSRGHKFWTEYDKLRRPLNMFVRGTTNDSDPRTLPKDILFEKIEYGESLPENDAIALNLRTRVFKQYDAAGVVTSKGHNSTTNKDEAYDFKGNLMRSIRQLCTLYDENTGQLEADKIPDWSQNPALEQEIFTSSTIYDALNRPVTSITPDGSIYRPTFNEANLLDKVDVNLRGAAVSTPFVININYDAKGQRILIDYGNGVRTTYKYDLDTFRLIHLYTARSSVDFPGDDPNPPNPPRGAQNLRYTYDPAGNITHIRDDAQQTVYFRNRRVEPSNDYTYDAIYRLIEATGREHLGQNGAGAPLPPTSTSYNDKSRVGLVHPGDGNAMGGYLEKYVYDEIGNFLKMIHQGSDPVHSGWTRAYYCNETSLIEGSKRSNRLTSTTVSGVTETYSTAGDGYDPHGNMLKMPQLQVMQWDFKDQLLISQRQAVNAQDVEGQQRQGERTYYVYDSSGQRVLKVTVSQNGNKKDERIYLGGFEVYRAYGTNALERETLHIMDDKQRIALVETKTLDTTGITDENNNDAVNQPVMRYQFSNHLGSACLELDADAKVICYEEYYPYGSTAYQAKNKNIKAAAKRYRYTGKERDDESGLYYHGARYYAPWLGRWASCDPLHGDIGAPMSLHRYLYAHGNPIIYTDPDGNAINLAAAGIGALIGGIGGAVIGAWTAKPGERWAGAAKAGAIGAGAGALAGLTFGVSLAATGAVGIGGTAVAGGGTTGSVLIAGTVAGTVGGGTGSAASALSEGAPAQEVWERGTIGAFTGSVGGAVGSATGVVTSKLASSAGASQLASYSLGGAAGGASGNVATQSVSIAGGLQETFSPAELLVSTAGGGAGGALAAKATAVKGPGVLGKQSTRDQLNRVAAVMERRGWRITHGGGRGPEEYLPGPGGARKGSSFPDLTATKNGKTIRVNTVDTKADGVTPTTREATNAARIRAQTDEHLILIPKKDK